MSKLKITYARVLVSEQLWPWDWQSRDGVEPPWIVLHDEPELLSNETLDKLYSEFSEGEPVDFAEFVRYLKNDYLYKVPVVQFGGVWQPLPEPEPRCDHCGHVLEKGK